MSKFTYDLHIHSCLSPCADNDNTPNNIAGMAHLSGIRIVALTDHNSAKNCPAFFDAARGYGIVPIAGMELTTSEDIHVVCLFENLESALDFDAKLQEYRVMIKNNERIFGEQLILNSEDEIVGKEEFLLSNATRISIESIREVITECGGVCFPAHIDRDANGIISVLGTLPDKPSFSSVEIHSAERVGEYIEKYDLSDKTVTVSSDAHYLADIGENGAEIDLECNADAGECEIRSALFKKLKNL